MRSPARPGEVAQGPLLELVVDLFLAQSEVEEPERRRACLDLALSLVPRAAPEALRAIASRPGLTEDVADAIVRRGDRDAVALLVANRSARLAPGSLAAVADLAWRDAGLRGAFVQRSDLPGAIVDKLWPSLHSGFKARLIASGFRYSMSEVEEVGRETSAALSDAGRSGALPQSIDTYAALVRDRLIAIDEALVEIMQNGRLVEAAQLIARCLGLRRGGRAQPALRRLRPRAGGARLPRRALRGRDPAHRRGAGAAVLGALDRSVPDAHDREGDHRHRGGRDPLRARRPLAGRGRQHRRPATLPQRRVTAQSRAARNVSHCWIWPLFRPFVSQRTRWAEEPWVKESGTT